VRKRELEQLLVFEAMAQRFFEVFEFSCAQYHGESLMHLQALRMTLQRPRLASLQD
jgi:hypothetical protein